ncbi:uncharacterized protein MCYG_06670 [Microsporum canis CBS 113480]|uniref:Uncharacterized protein n=1 Tax=Arthroderma otae (strain ATCC MYA-4605 / CBS 113480) TaxID=554155 RepID=C5FVB7_ARTOC|nr:uncharacterized protein MCYG_06670 [Microsporum canis CBS 113480]EEQ33851.1 predicted protein [Microsporum canis CBS 113480]
MARVDGQPTERKGKNQKQSRSGAREREDVGKKKKRREAGEIVEEARTGEVGCRSTEEEDEVEEATLKSPDRDEPSFDDFFLFPTLNQEEADDVATSDDEQDEAADILQTRERENGQGHVP